MEFISNYVCEQKRYTKNEIKILFRQTEADTEAFIKTLKAFGILKAVKNNPTQRELSDLLDEYIEVADVVAGNEEFFYVFTYVGVITVGNRVIKCYPKYLVSADKLDKMKKVLKVLTRYGTKKQIVNLYNGDEENSSFNLLAVILFLINDYLENGLYTNTEEIIEMDGVGQILWDKTINESFAMISKNRPYYIDFYTCRSVDDEQDFFLRLHKYILSECSRQLDDSELLTLFDLEAVNLSEETLLNFGDDDYILYRLQSELNIQFNTRKQILLKTLYAYIIHHKTLEDSYGISMYGTTSFNKVWEDVCAEVFSNKLNVQLQNLPLPAGVAEGYDPKDNLIDLIERPKWKGYRPDGETFEKEASETLIPDLINIYEKNGVYHFVIFDAKYYCIQLEQEKLLRGQPGVGDITKQYLYQLAYMDFLNAHQITDVKNCFLMPTNSNEIVKKGCVSMSMLHELGLQEIQIRLLPADMMYDYYLSNRNMDIESLVL